MDKSVEPVNPVETTFFNKSRAKPMLDAARRSMINRLSERLGQLADRLYALTGTKMRSTLLRAAPSLCMKYRRRLGPGKKDLSHSPRMPDECLKQVAVQADFSMRLDVKPCSFVNTM